MGRKVAVKDFKENFEESRCTLRNKNKWIGMKEGRYMYNNIGAKLFGHGKAGLRGENRSC